MANWDDYRVFLAVARSGSLSSAATLLKMDPATVGRRVQRLEDRLGARVFTKLPRGYELTQAGRDMQAHIEQIESVERIARGVVQDSDDNLTGTIRLGATDGLSNYVLPKVCGDIAVQYPDLNIEILSLPPVFNLSKREADLAIVVTPPKSGRLRTQKITNYHLHLAAHESYLAKAAKITSTNDIKNHPIIGYIPDLIFDPSVDHSSEIFPSRPPNLSSNSVSVQMQLVGQGAGISVIHDFALAHFPEFKQVLRNEVSLIRSFYLVRLKDDHANDRLNRFADLLMHGMQQEITRLESLV